MLSENPNFFDSLDTDISFQDLIRALRNILELNVQPELHFQEIEQTTYGNVTDFITEILQKLMDLLKTGWKMMKQFFVRMDNVVKEWLYSDNILARIINIITNEIFISSKKFNTEISIEMTEAYKKHPFKEIEIDVKVPEEMDIYKLNEFWDYIGEKVDAIIDNEQFIDPKKAKEVKERLLIVVSK